MAAPRRQPESEPAPPPPEGQPAMTQQQSPPAFVFLDTETTSLDTRRGDVIEAAWAVNDGRINTILFPHTLDSADPKALEVNRYYERGLHRWGTAPGHPPLGHGQDHRDDYHLFVRDLAGATIVAENYGFDCAMLLRKLGYEPWHYRKIELSSVAMTVFVLDAPEGMAKTADRLRALGFDIPVPDHSAAADVECLRACYQALRALRIAGGEHEGWAAHLGYGPAAV